MMQRFIPCARRLSSAVIAFSVVAAAVVPAGASSGYRFVRPLNAASGTYTGIITGYQEQNGLGAFALEVNGGQHVFSVGTRMRVNGQTTNCRNADPVVAPFVGCTDWPKTIVIGKSVVTATCWVDMTYSQVAYRLPSRNATLVCDRIDSGTSRQHVNPAAMPENTSLAYFPLRPADARVRTYTGVIKNYALDKDFGGFDVVVDGKELGLHLSGRMLVDGERVACGQVDPGAANFATCDDVPSSIVLGKTTVTATCWHDYIFAERVTLQERPQSLVFCDRIDSVVAPKDLSSHTTAETNRK